MADAVIRATASYREAQEPMKQKPIIKVNPQDLMMEAHMREAQQLASRVRASIDSGRDNPFKPDGEIYKLTNPIVDYYKFGPNQSRSQTPTYDELDYFSSKNKRKRRKEEKTKRSLASGEARKSCWRRWFCCCCTSRCCQSKTGKQEEQQDDTMNPYNQKSITEDKQRIIATNSVGEPEGELQTRITATTRAGTDLTASNGGLGGVQGQPKQELVQQPKKKEKNKKDKSKNKKKKQTKVVLLSGDYDRTTTMLAPNKGIAASRTQQDDTCAYPATPMTQMTSKPETTQVKTVKPSRCVIS